jgi:hypothetical protein
MYGANDGRKSQNRYFREILKGRMKLNKYVKGMLN